MAPEEAVQDYFDMGMISSAQSSANNSKGGDGANGKIIQGGRE